MLYTTKKWLVLAVLLLTGTASYAQHNEPNDTALQRLLQLKDSVVLQHTLQTLGASGSEDDLMRVANYYYAKQIRHAQDSVTKIALQRYPGGYAAFDEQLNVIYEEKDPAANEEHYKAYVSRFGSDPRFAHHRFMDFARYYVAVSCKSIPEKLYYYLNLIEDTVYKTRAYSFAARETFANKQYLLAQELIEKPMNDMARRGDSSSTDYYRCAGQYAAILLENKDYRKGLSYARTAYAHMTFKDLALADVYLNLLVANNELRDAFPMMTESIKTGRAGETVKAQFKNAYVQVHGSDQGFAELETALNDSLALHVKNMIAKNKVNEPGFDFELQNTEGKTVRLSDYRGKVVVLDFWATWCSPCKASFPNMQAAVNKYRNDTNVVFLFMHTWETSSTPVKDAAAYIKANHYTFQVVMDVKNPADGICKAAMGFKVKGLPTKLILDKEGHICFKSLGAAVGASDAFLMEMSTMIELAKAGS